MAYTVCCKMRPNAQRLQAQIAGRIVGDKKCGARKVGNDRYQTDDGLEKIDMNCTAWCAQGICSKWRRGKRRAPRPGRRPALTDPPPEAYIPP